MSPEVSGPAADSAREAEWLETDGLGGFAMGTVDGIRTRRYHGLLVHAATPPTGRVALVNGFEAWVEAWNSRTPITSQRYAPDVIFPDGASRIRSFDPEPWPRWRLDLGRGETLEQEIFLRHGLPLAVVRWSADWATSGRLVVRPLLSGRDFHALHHANDAFRFEPERLGARLRWKPYDGIPGLLMLANGTYEHAPDWYRDFLYSEERERGLDDREDLATPGTFTFDLSRPAVWIVAADTPETRALLDDGDAEDVARRLRESERRRRTSFPSRLHRAADAYVVARGRGRTIVAGYPWFGDWGRDTFIALRGLCLAGGRLEDARRILVEWAGAVSEGMLPNRFADRGDVPEFNSVDASLWYVVAVHDWLEAMASAGRAPSRRDETALAGAVIAILDGYARGTRHGIREDGDGLLAAGEPGVQLTWMDAKVGDWVVTPRVGKPVEVQALWINAQRIAARFDPRWKERSGRSLASFQARFWNESSGMLYDVVDVDHVPGRVDSAFRPNQIFAVGGLPFPILDGARARAVVDAVERGLATPLGLRSLAPSEPGYAPRYSGGVLERDGAYHQGTVWPWLAGPFVEAWVRVRGDGAPAKREAWERFVAPLEAHLGRAGLGHVSEIADAEPPHRPNGCPFQAWSVGELMRLRYAGIGPGEVLPASSTASARASTSSSRVRGFTKQARSQNTPSMTVLDRNARPPS